MKLVLNLSVAMILSFSFAQNAQAIWGTLGEIVTFGLYDSEDKPVSLSTDEARTYDQVEQAIKNTNNEVRELNTTINGTRGSYLSAEKELEKLQQDISRQNAEFEKSRANLQNATKGFESEGATEERLIADAGNLVKANRRLKELKASIDSPTRQRETAIRELNEREKELEEKLKKAKMYDTARNKITKLENTIAEMRLSTSIEEFNDRIRETEWDLNLGYEALERVYDNSMLKAYMKKKLENVLNSSSICSSVRQCMESNATSPRNVKINDDEVFGSKNKTESRGGTSR
ncbi:MAG: hypothetical protein SGJ18_12680 [Pseudomonadota bacterium]|nr:hypothetical protein [Pseudomonadota bacterium]